MFIKSFNETELMEIAKESIAIIEGRSIHSGTRPFYHGKDRLRNQMVCTVQYRDKNISMFHVVKDWNKRGLYILEAEYIDVIFSIPFTSKTSVEDLYKILKITYQKYDKSFIEYKLELTDGSAIIARTNDDIEKVRNYYIGKWFKDNKWYGLLAVLDCDIYPRCNNVVTI